MKHRALIQLTSAVLLAAMLTGSTLAQVGRSQGLLDANLATEKELAALPHLNADLAKPRNTQRGKAATEMTLTTDFTDDTDEKRGAIRVIREIRGPKICASCENFHG